jgi:hypothetical protein
MDECRKSGAGLIAVTLLIAEINGGGKCGMAY